MGKEFLNKIQKEQTIKEKTYKFSYIKISVYW